MLPAPVAEGASHGVVRQITEAAGEKLSRSNSTSSRAAPNSSSWQRPPPPAWLIRAPSPERGPAPPPVIASCVAIGGGAAACVEQGVDSLGAAKGLIASAPEEKGPEETTPPPEAESTGPTYTPAETPVEEEPAEPVAESLFQPQPQPEPQPKPGLKAEPAPEESFEPASTSSQSSETESESSYEATEEAPAPEPAPAPASGGSQFGGPCREHGDQLTRSRDFGDGPPRPAAGRARSSAAGGGWRVHDPYLRGRRSRLHQLGLRGVRRAGDEVEAGLRSARAGASRDRVRERLPPRPGAASWRTSHCCLRYFSRAAAIAGS
jgi:hypothetical protein